MNTITVPRFNVNVDRMCDLTDLVRLEFESHVFSGKFAHTASLTVNSPVAPRDIIDQSWTIKRVASNDMQVVVLVSIVCDDIQGEVLIAAFPQSTTIRVAATRYEDAQHVASMLRSRVPETAKGVRLRSWYMTNDEDPRMTDRTVATSTWSDIAINYPPVIRGQLAASMRMSAPTSTARLILWHGEPGTGKTTALRALLHEWRAWCDGHYIADPERFFASAGYITEVMTRPPNHSSRPTFTNTVGDQERWRVVIAEDTDEYLRSTARRDAGASLGRLLNLADGLLGQGHQTLLLLTTNEELNRLHPALIRPGRCLTRIEFTRFSPTEATTSFPNRPTLNRPATLAELFHHDNRTTPDATGGQYL